MKLISAYPFGSPKFGTPAAGESACVPAEQTPHQDPGFVGVKRKDTGKYLRVSADGQPHWDRDSAGSEERMTVTDGNTITAFRGNGHDNGDPKGIPFVFFKA